MHSSAKFHLKCRISLENTVSASKRCKDLKMHIAKFDVKSTFHLENTVSAQKIYVTTGKWTV